MSEVDVAEADAVATLVGPSLAGIQRLTAVNTVRARIALAVDLGLLSPGERLPPVPDVAAALDVSEASVRRALEALTQDGVLVRLRGRSGGTLVAEAPTRGSVAEVDAYRSEKEHVHELIDQRIVLDIGVAALAARAATKVQLTRLRRLVDRMDRAATWAEFHQADEQFHVGVAESTRLPSIAGPYCSVLHELYRFYLPYPVEYLRQSNTEHRQLVAALADRDVASAADVARRHVERLHETMFMGLMDAATADPVKH
jgi:DNA-binding FadR family transcriptional regulator